MIYFTGMESIFTTLEDGMKEIFTKGKDKAWVS